VDHRQISTLDLYGRGFVLLAGVDGAGWMAAAASLQVPVAAYRFGVELTPADGVAVHGIGFGEPCWSGPTASSPGAASAGPRPPPSSGASSAPF
jgi:hypothetical protein